LAFLRRHRHAWLPLGSGVRGSRSRRHRYSPRDPPVIANGSISGSIYGGFFEIPPATILAENPAAPTLDDVVISFLLLSLRPEIDPLDPDLQVTLSVNGGTPDPDALGILTQQPNELDYPRFDTCPG
jgi:hypothetical protein